LFQQQKRTGHKRAKRWPGFKNVEIDLLLAGSDIYFGSIV
jgi:hypothetical protein